MKRRPGPKSLKFFDSCPTPNPKRALNKLYPMLTIRNYERIKGMCFYEGSGWDTQLYTSAQKAGAKAYAEWIEEDEDRYRIRIMHIQPQPESSMVTIYREAEKGGYRVTIYKGNDMVHNAVWMPGDITMEGVLETIRRDCIYGKV